VAKAQRKHTDEEILNILTEHYCGLSARAIIRRHGISLDTIYRWKRTFSGVKKHDVRRLRTLKNENARLKRMVADQALNIQVLKDALGKGRDPGRAPRGGHGGPDAVRNAARDGLPLPRGSSRAAAVCVAARGARDTAGAAPHGRRREAALGHSTPHVAVAA